MNVRRTHTHASLAAALLFGGLVLLAVADVRGQSKEGGWETSGEEGRDAEIVRRYKGMLEENPREGVVFEKLVEHVGRGEGLDRLVEQYRQKVDQHPDRVAYRLLLGHLLKVRHDYEKALEHYNRVLEEESSNPIALASRGAVRAEQGRRNEALEDYERALESTERAGRKKKLLRKLADLAFRQHDWERAESYYERLLEMDPRNEYLRVEFAQTLVEHERWEKALEQYRTLLELSGRNPKARAKTLRDMGDVYEKKGDDDQAVETYRRAMDLMRSSHWLHEELRDRIVEVYRRNDELPELIERYERRWGSPGYDSSMFLANLSDEAGLEEKALEYFRRAKRLRSREPKPREKLVEIWRRRGETEKVLEGYRRLVDVAPDESRFYFRLVELHMQDGRRDEAEDWMDRIERRFDDQPSVYGKLAQTYRRYGMNRRALETYEALVEMAPDNESYILSLGESYYRTGDVERAVETWKKILETSMAEADARARLGEAFVEHGMIERAVRQHRKAVELRPDDLRLRRGLASVYERARRWDKAIEVWREIMNRADGPAKVAKARGRIIRIYDKQNRLRAKMDEFRRQYTKGEKGEQRVEAGFFLAEAHRTLNQHERAEETYRRLIDMEATPEDQKAEAYRSLQRIYRETGELEKAVEVLRALAELVPARQRSYYQEIAELSLKLYEDDQAVEYAALAVEKNPEDPEAHAKLAEVYREMQKLEAAVEEYRRAVQLGPERYEYAMALAEVLARIGEEDEARETYRRIAREADERSLVLRSARRAMDLYEEAGELESLESMFTDLAFRGRESDVYRKILMEIYERMLTPAVLRARYGIGEEREGARRQLEEAGSRAVPVLKSALHDGGVGKRALAIRLLGGMRADSASVTLAQLAGDPKESLRTLAAVSVAEIGDPRAADALVGALDASESSLREMATWALGHLEGDAARKGLLRQLDKGQNWTERALAAIGLGRVGGSGVADALLEALDKVSVRQDEEGLVAALVWAVGRTGDRGAVERLTEVFQKGPDALRPLVAEALAEVGGGGAVDSLLEGLWSQREKLHMPANSGLVALARRLDEPDADGADRAEVLARDLEFVADRQNQIDVQGLTERLYEETQSPGTRRATAFFEQFGARAAEKVASRLGDDPDADRRILATLHREGQLRLGPLVPADEAGRRAWSGALSELASPLASRVDGESPGLAAHAVELYGHLGGSGRREVLHRAIEEREIVVRRAAFRAIAELPPKEASVDLVVSRIDADSFLERRAAARTLGRLAGRAPDAFGERAVEALAAQLDAAYPSVRMAAARGLAAVGTEPAVDALAERLDGMEPRVKIAALEALAALESDRVASLLAPYRDHADIRYRRAAGSD